MERGRERERERERKMIWKIEKEIETLMVLLKFLWFLFFKYLRILSFLSSTEYLPTFVLDSSIPAIWFPWIPYKIPNTISKKNHLSIPLRFPLISMQWERTISDHCKKLPIPSSYKTTHAMHSHEFACSPNYLPP